MLLDLHGMGSGHGAGGMVVSGSGVVHTAVVGQVEVSGGGQVLSVSTVTKTHMKHSLRHIILPPVLPTIILATSIWFTPLASGMVQRYLPVGETALFLLFRLVV